jgi:hypothetical protein
MPPKRQEPVFVAEPPEHTPLNEALVARAVSIALRDGLGDQRPLSALLASALSVADSYAVVRADRDTVDYAADVVRFAAATLGAAAPRKAFRLLTLMLELRESVLRGDPAAARARLKAWATAEVAAYNREAALQAAVAAAADALAAEQGASPVNTRGGFAAAAPGAGGGSGAPLAGGGAAGAGAATGNAAGGGGGPTTRSGKARDAAEAAPPPPVVPAHAQYFSTADIGEVIDFAACGLLQHWRLFQAASAAGADAPGADASDALDLDAPRASVEVGAGAGAAADAPARPPRFVVLQQIVPPARPPPLRAALPLADWDAAERARRAGVAAELSRLQGEERAALEREAREAAARAAAEERQRQEAEAARLFFERHGTDLAVTHVQKELQQDIGQRHAALLARVARLEDIYRITV